MAVCFVFSDCGLLLPMGILVVLGCWWPQCQQQVLLRLWASTNVSNQLHRICTKNQNNAVETININELANKESCNYETVRAKPIIQSVEYIQFDDCCTRILTCGFGCFTVFVFGCFWWFRYHRLACIWFLNGCVCGCLRELTHGRRDSAYGACKAKQPPAYANTVRSTFLRWRWPSV